MLTSQANSSLSIAHCSTEGGPGGPLTCDRHARHIGCGAPWRVHAEIRRWVCSNAQTSWLWHCIDCKRNVIRYQYHDWVTSGRLPLMSSSTRVLHACCRCQLMTVVEQATQAKHGRQRVPDRSDFAPRQAPLPQARCATSI